jgi:hypothetical protein
MYKKRKRTKKAAACPRKLAQIREILWPGGDRDFQWSPDTIDEVARIVGLPPQRRRR